MKGIFREPVMVLLFSIITCGIYGIYWLYTARCEMKAYLEDSAINPLLDVVLSLVCFPYFFYLFYKMGKDIVRMQKKAGISENDSSVLFIILALVGVGVVNFMIAQENMNAVWKAE